MSDESISRQHAKVTPRDQGGFLLTDLKSRHGTWRQTRGRVGLAVGQEILIESVSDSPIAVSFLAERTIFPAFGIEGGQPGAPGELRINGARSDPKRQYVLRRGDTVSMATPGGGGHGDPRLRDGAAIDADLADGTLTDAKPYRGA